MVRRPGDGGYRVLPCHGSAWFRLMAAAMIATGGVVLGMSVSAFGASTAAPHVMVIMMENKNFSDVIGQADQPYTNELATNGGLATDSYSMVTGSLPNYLAIISGSTQNDTDNVTPSQVNFPNTATLADQLATAGYTAKAYAEGLPADPSTNSGTYEVDHFPWPYFPNAQITSADSSTLLSDLDSADAPDFVWYSPDNIDDEDSGTVQQGDAFLSSLVPQVQATPWYQDGGKIIIEWDESNNDTTGINGGTGGGRIPTIVVSAALSANPQQDSTPVDTVGILHSIENVYGLPYLTGATDPSNGNIDALLDEGSAPPTTTTTVAPTTTTTVAPTTTTTEPPTTTTTEPPTTTTTEPPPTTTTEPTPGKSNATTPATTTVVASAPTSAATTTTATDPNPGPPSSGDAGEGTGSSDHPGGSSGSSIVTASSSALAFTGNGHGVGALAVLGGGLVLLGLVLLALLEMPRRLVGLIPSVDSRPVRGERNRPDLTEGPPLRSDLWLVPPS